MALRDSQRLFRILLPHLQSLQHPLCAMAALWPSNVTGGAHVQDGIVSYIPACSDIHYGAISASRAAQFDITTWDYVVDVSLVCSVQSMVGQLLHATLLAPCTRAPSLPP